MIYAVFDTNVFVSALLSRHSDAATVKVVSLISKTGIRPLYVAEAAIGLPNLRRFGRFLLAVCREMITFAENYGAELPILHEFTEYNSSF